MALPPIVDPASAPVGAPAPVASPPVAQYRGAENQFIDSEGAFEIDPGRYYHPDWTGTLQDGSPYKGPAMIDLDPMGSFIKATPVAGTLGAQQPGPTAGDQGGQPGEGMVAGLAGLLEKLGIPLGKGLKGVKAAPTGGIRFQKSTLPQAVVEETRRAFGGFEAELDIARRGERPHALALQEAEALLKKNKWTLDDIRNIMPGTAMNDTDALAVIKRVSDYVEADIQPLAARLVASMDAGTALTPAEWQEFGTKLFAMRQFLAPRAGVVAEAGRTLSVMNEPVSGMNQFLDQFENLFHNPPPGVSPEWIVRIVNNFDNPLQFAKVAELVTKPGWTDMAIEGLYGIALLSNPKTLGVNALGSVLSALYAPVLRTGMAVVGSETHWTEPAYLLFGYGKSIPRAWSVFWKALSTGERTLEGGAKITMPRNPSITAENVGRLAHEYGSWVSPEHLEYTLAGKMIDSFGFGARLFPRAMLATDEFAKAMFYDGSLWARAARESAKVADEAERTRVFQRIVTNQDHAARLEAQTFANEFTFNAPPGPLLSGVIHGVESLPGPYKVLFKSTIPFLAIPTNLFKFTARNAPGLQQLHASWIADLRAPGVRQDRALAELSMGGAWLFGVVHYAANGGIVGAAPADPNLRREWLADGNLEQSFVFPGGKQIGFNRADPFGQIVGVVADWVSISAHLSEADNNQVAMALMMAVSKNLMSKTYLEGASEVMDAISAGDPNKTYRFLQHFVTTPVPGIVRGLRYANDPYIRVVRTMVDAYKNKIPGYSTDLPVSRNIFAHPLMYEDPVGLFGWIRPFAIKTKKDNPAIDALLKDQISVSMPGWYVYGKQGQAWSLEPDPASTGIELTPHQRDWMIQRIGVPLEKEWTKYVQSDQYKTHSGGPDGVHALVFRKLYSSYRNAAVKELLVKYPEIQTKFVDRLNAKAEALRSPAPAPSGGGGLSIGGTKLKGR